MKVLAIETSCDETAIAILDCSSDSFEVLSHALISQIDIHREYGGVFPAMAKRAHAKNLVPILGAALEEAEMLHEDMQVISEDVRAELSKLLEREPDMTEAFIQFITETERPTIDAIAVTYGPGLAPALWVGVNFAQALALAWNIPLVPVNHMEGHFLIALAKSSEATAVPGVSTKQVLTIESQETPILGLLISGGHTQLVLMENWLSYRLLGETKDDAVGEAFDKVARMMGLPYPGGPEISQLAEHDREDRTSRDANPFKLPRPMISTQDFNFSFSGLKTAVLYTLKDLAKARTGETSATAAEITQIEKEQLSREFEDAAADVLVSKTLRALEETQAQTLVVGGGVSANTYIRRRFEEAIAEKLPYIDLHFPPAGLTGDNGVMIGIAGFYRAQCQEFTEPGTLVADGNLSLSAK